MSQLSFAGRARTVTAMCCVLALASVVQCSNALADVVFEGIGFGQHWQLDDCINVSAAGMTITCPPAVPFAVGCYARIGDELFNVPTGIRIEYEFDGYAWLSLFDNCGQVFEFQPQNNFGYTSFIADFRCAGDVRRAGQNVAWSTGPQLWVFEIDNLVAAGGQPLRRLLVTAPDGQTYQHELTMPSLYPLMGELSFYYGAERTHSSTIRRVVLRGEDVVGIEGATWGAIKSQYR